jgi:hypothetical protein
MHELPHAPRQSLREPISRLYLVGPGDRWRIHVSQDAIEPMDDVLVIETQTNQKQPRREVFGETKNFLRKSPN